MLSAPESFSMFHSNVLLSKRSAPAVVASPAVETPVVQTTRCSAHQRDCIKHYIALVQHLVGIFFDTEHVLVIRQLIKLSIGRFVVDENSFDEQPVTFYYQDINTICGALQLPPSRVRKVLYKLLEDKILKTAIAEPRWGVDFQNLVAVIKSRLIFMWNNFEVNAQNAQMFFCRRCQLTVADLNINDPPCCHHQEELEEIDPPPCDSTKSLKQEFILQTQELRMLINKSEIYLAPRLARIPQALSNPNMTYKGESAGTPLPSANLPSENSPSQNWNQSGITLKQIFEDSSPKRDCISRDNDADLFDEL